MRWMNALAPGAIVIAAACGGTATPGLDQRSPMASTASPPNTPMPVPASATHSPSPERLATLKKRFVFHPDKIRGGGVYTHRSQTPENSYDRSYLSATVVDDGAIFFHSEYAGERWLFHTRVVARVGSQIIETEEVPGFDPENLRTSGSDLVWERVTFTDGRDNGLLEAIATHPNDTVRVRMIGGGVKEFILSARDKNAIRDSYELSQLLKP